MQDEIINLNKNNIGLFFEILSKVKIDGMVNHSIDIKIFEKYLKLLDIREKVSFIFRCGEKNIGLFLATMRKEKAYIPAIAVLKNFQGKGFGKIILQNGISLLKESKIKKIFLEVAFNNSQALNLYSSQGFEITNEILNFRNESNSFFISSLVFDKQFKIEESNPLLFTIVYKNFQANQDCPWQKRLFYLNTKLNSGDSQIYIINKNSKLFGYFIISRIVNTLQIEDFGLKENDIKILGYILSKLIKHEKIVQMNNFYKDDRRTDLLVKNGFFVDLMQYEMKKVLK